MATPTIPKPRAPSALRTGAPQALGTGARPPALDRTLAGRHMPSWLPALVARLELTLALIALLGTGLFVATLVAGRSALFWPSARWLLAAGGTVGAGGCLWWLGARMLPGGGWRRWQASCWPMLALLPSAAAGGALYLDDASHHLATTYTPAKQLLLAYAGVLFGAAQAGYWLVVLARAGRHATAAPPLRRMMPPVVLGLAAAAYVNASIYGQWMPRQTDLSVNLRGARDLIVGGLPYHDGIPVWADRVHLLPSTLLLLFGPLALLPEGAARTVFFLGNQALWLVAMWLFICRLAPPEQRLPWLAGALMLGATFWPWQESIRFGQQDGLLLLLFVLSITAAARGRDGEAGLALGLALLVKPLSVWLPLAYMVHGRWRALLIAGATAGSLALLTLPLTGWEAWRHFFYVEVPEMLPGTVRGTNIPLPSLHARFFVGREALSDGNPAPTLAIISALNGAANVVALLLFGRLALSRSSHRRREWLLDAALGLTLTLLLAPMAWQHYASWLCLDFLILALPAVWHPLPWAARASSGGLAGLAFLLLSLEDGRLLAILQPVVERWPGALALYSAGLLCLAAAVVISRFGAQSRGA